MTIAPHYDDSSSRDLYDSAQPQTPSALREKAGVSSLSNNFRNFIKALTLDGGGFACPPSRAAQARRAGVGVITLPLIPSRQGRGADLFE
jgi:hypothetical protein